MSYLDTDALELSRKGLELANQTAAHLQEQLRAARETNAAMGRALERTTKVVQSLRAQNQALSGALLRMAHYARHLPSCAGSPEIIGWGLDGPIVTPCDCGLVAVTDEASKAVLP